MSGLHVICLNAGNYLGHGTEYVNKLYDQVTRNLPEGFPGSFTCFTDDLSLTTNPAILRRHLPHEGLQGWWNKLALFKPGLFPAGDRVLYFDLDTIITGPLDALAQYHGDFAILRDFYRPGGLQSSVIAWEADTHANLWEAFELAQYPQTDPGGDQSFMEKHLHNPNILQNLFPGLFVSYKVHARLGIPKGASVVCFHGLPRPHEVETGWVPQIWKIGVGTPAQLELVGNTDADAIKTNILRAEAIPDATWLMPCKPHDKVALICAGGPSLNDEIISVVVHAQRGAHVFACNNVPARLRVNGINTDFHVIVDARPENAAFTRDLGEHTICLYASQCDTSVHDGAGDNLVLWHPAFDGAVAMAGAHERAFIGGGTTCGMKAATIAWVLGYREIHLYGFDSCYRGSEHHAYPQSLNDHERVLDVEYDGKTYKCAPWMIQQAEDFETFGPQLMDHGVKLHVHGSGLIPDIAANFGRGVFRPEAADFRCLAILERLQPVSSPRVAEIGVFAGDLSRRLLARRSDLNLLMIDSWANTSDGYKDSQDYHSTLSAEAQEKFFQLASNVTAPFQDRRTIMRMDSKEAARAIPDKSLDLAFIDADHSYEGCKSDLEAYWPKVKPGGILSGHDYANDDWKFGPMVKRAVDEFAAAKGLTVDLGENFTYFLSKPNEDAA